MDTLQKLGVPISIVIAGGLIAVAVFYSNKGTVVSGPPKEGAVMQNVRGVEPDDHVLGNRDAKVVIVEYSDFECPFCKQFHQTMHRIISEYGQSGDVAWVYRNFPLDSLHAKARTEALAAECAASLGGNETFWKFANKVFEITPSNDGLYIGDYDVDPSNPTGTNAGQLTEIAVSLGLDKTRFESCIAAGTHAERIQKEEDEVIAAGGRGTPHSIVIFEGEQISLEGAQPYDVVKGLIDTMLDR